MWLKRQKPQGSRQLLDSSDFCCQRATFLMIEPVSGFAPMEWQDMVGPVLVYRPGGLKLDSNDVNLLIDWFSCLLENYPEDDFDYREWLTPYAFQRFKNTYAR